MAGTIAGKVIDIRNNMPIANATVSASNGTSESATTGDDGSYSLGGLEESMSPGYNVDVKASGYQEWIAQGIVVINDVTTPINIGLMPAEE